MRIQCMIKNELVHVVGDICFGCKGSEGRSAQIIRGTDGKIDACIVCPLQGEEDKLLRVIRSEGGEMRNKRGKRVESS